MAFEKGNNLAAKSRVFDNALRRAIAQDDGKRIRDCVEKLLDLAAEGEPWAVREVADRLDGKPAQTLDLRDSSSLQEMSREEILERLAALRREVAPGAPKPGRRADKSPRVH